MRAAATALLVLAATTARADHATPEQIEAAMRAAATEAKAYADESTMVTGLQRAQASGADDPLAAEARLLQLLIRLREVRAPQAQTRAVVAALLDHAPRTMTDPVDPEQRGLQRPAFAVAGAARERFHCQSP